MSVGDPVDVSGYVTKDKYLAGRSLSEIESYLGFHTGRLSRGATFAKLTRLPRDGEFDLAAYSMTAAHRYRPATGLDLGRVKAMAMESWALSGGDRLIKVYPSIGHDRAMSDDDQYPPGQGVPQWRILKDVKIPGVIVAELKTSSDKYVPAL